MRKREREREREREERERANKQNLIKLYVFISNCAIKIK